jgi:hypothetical protein
MQVLSMDVGQMTQQVNSAINRALMAVIDYFTDLNQLEMYGWCAVVAGVIMLIIGIIIL